jgi:hypothetical protein
VGRYRRRKGRIVTERTSLFGYIQGSGERPSKSQVECAKGFLDGSLFQDELRTRLYPVVAWDIAREIVREFERHLARDHTVPPLTVGDACPSGRPYPHTWDAQCARTRGRSEVPTIQSGGTIRAADMTPLPDPPWAETPAAFVLPGSESTSERLRQVMAALAASQADLTKALDDRDKLATAVAGWVARWHAAYEALYIEEFDGDSCPDLETTIEYAVQAYRRVCASEAAAADQIDQLRADLTRTGQERDAVGTKLVAALRERDQARGERDRFIKAADKLHGEWLDLKADLAQVRLLWAEESARLKTERNDARRERDWWIAATESARNDRDHIARENDLLRADLTAESRRVVQLQALLAEAARQRDLNIAEVATASKEVKALRAARQWIADALAHIHCRTEGEPTT